MIDVGMGPIIVNNVIREARDIHIYNKDGILFTVSAYDLKDLGNKRIEGFQLHDFDEIKLRRKEKFDGQLYIMPRKTSWSSTNYCDIYIPNSSARFSIVDRIVEIREPYVSVVDVWESEFVGVRYRQNRSDIRIDTNLNSIVARFEGILKDFDFRIEKDGVLDKIHQLAKIKEEYDNELANIKTINLDDLG